MKILRVDYRTLGIDVGGTNVTVGEFCGNREGLGCRSGMDSFKTFGRPEIASLGDALGAVEAAAEREEIFCRGGTLKGWGLPGPVDRSSGEDPRLRTMVNVQEGDGEPVSVPHTAVNDGMASLFGSSVIGAAKSHSGPVIMLVLGTGVACAVKTRAFDGKFALLSPEIHHMTIPGLPHMCGCNRLGCIEAAVNQAYLLKTAQEAEYGLDMAGHEKRVGERLVELRLNEKHTDSVDAILVRWHNHLILLVHSVLAHYNQPDTLVIIGGGLASLVDCPAVKEGVLALRNGISYFGTDWDVVHEHTFGDPPQSVIPCVGAAAWALANQLDRENPNPFAIKWVGDHLPKMPHA